MVTKTNSSKVPPRSVFTPILILAVAITTLVAVVLTVQSSFMTAKLSKDSVRLEARQTLSNLSANSGGALKFGKTEAIDEMLSSSLEAHPDSYFAVAVNQSGDVVSEVGSLPSAERAALVALMTSSIDNAERQTSADGFLISEHVVFGKKKTVVGAIGTAWTPDAVMEKVAFQRNITIAGVVVLLAILMMFFSTVVRRKVSTPLQSLGDVMNRVSDGQYDIKVPSLQRNDEIGTIASALDQMLEKLRKGQEADALREREAEEQKDVVERLTLALQALSAGDLRGSINEPFPASYDGLRINLNDAKRTLRDMVCSVIDGSDNVRGNVGELTAASGDLARRTENQAATLEQTAAALEQMTASVKSSTDIARSADSYAGDAQQDASAGEKVVREAVAAMSEIEGSSKQIEKIISVIDDIAFQTNLLALNAGVEAARAGESGRGFAVVASEVRALALRASEAAREIGELINTSVQQVEQGSALVLNTGEALHKIVTNTDTIRKLVADISVASTEQSTGLTEINTAMSQLDTVTQQNAAMVEEATASCHDLTSEAERLVTLTRSFQVNGDAGAGVTDDYHAAA